MNISYRIKTILKNLPRNVNLVAVSKKKTIEKIMEAYSAGQRVFGENQVMELKEKSEQLPTDIEWHMIGHLQRNKVKYIAPFISLIHSVDSLRLLAEIDKRAKQNNRIINCLLQVHIAKEKTKFGFLPNEIEKVLTHKYQNIKIVGLMGMATFTNSIKQINQEFSLLKKLFDEVKNNTITILSMGMSDDYMIGINNGSNLIRIGSGIFGKRK